MAWGLPTLGSVLGAPEAQGLSTHCGAGPAETVISKHRGKSEIQAGSAGPAQFMVASCQSFH